MEYRALAEMLLTHLGGKNNIISNTACMTRLRVGVRDKNLVNTEALRQTEGVLGLVISDTMQIVLGLGKAGKTLAEFSLLTGIQPDEISEGRTLETRAQEHKKALRQKYDRPLQRFLKRIANIFIALLPGIIAAGLINGLTNVITVSTGGALSGHWWYETIRTMGWALFAYLPILVGANTAREFGGSASLGAIAGALCIVNSAMPLLSSYEGSQIILPFSNAVFNPSAGGLIAALLSGMFFAFLEKHIRRIMPQIIDTFISPLLVLAAGGLLIVIIIQPVGAVLTSLIFSALSFVYDKLGIFGGFILSAGFLPLVAVGLHQALTPIHALLNDPHGPTHGINNLLPLLMMAGGGQVGSALALYCKTSNTRLKRLIRDAVPVGILGVGEPLMYAVTLPLGRPFIAACLGSGFGGALASAFHLGTVSQGVSGLFGLLIVEPGQQLLYIASMLASYAAGFVLTWFFAVDEQRISAVCGN